MHALLKKIKFTTLSYCIEEKHSLTVCHRLVFAAYLTQSLNQSFIMQVVP